MKIKVNADSCIACGACEAISEELFEVGEACKVKKEEVPEELQNAAKEAIDSCPTGAIEEQ